MRRKAIRESLVGKKFNRLTVLEKTDKRMSSNVIYTCRCDCGKITEVASNNLLRGHTKSCGCLVLQRVKERNSKKEFYEGQRFGKLTIICKTEKRDGKNIVYKCKCDCGNITEVSSNKLKTGHTKSCGCYKKDWANEYYTIHNNQVGERFGKLTVIERVGIANRQAVYKCKCDCGNIVEVKSGQLKSGKTQSCGCIKSQGEFKISKILRENNIPFVMQKTFDDCINPKTNAHFFFDFYVDNRYLIEYDGVQHYKALGGWGTKEYLQRVQEADRMKDEYCKQKNIPLLRIHYNKYKSLKLKDLLLN